MFQVPPPIIDGWSPCGDFYEESRTKLGKLNTGEIVYLRKLKEND